MTDQLVRFVHAIRSLDLKKAPAISETVDWAKSLVLLHAKDLDGSLVQDTLNVLLKYEEDIQIAEGQLPKLMAPPQADVVGGFPHTARAAASSDQLLAFVHYLRGKKIRPPADTLDAVEVAELVGYQNRALLKNGLAAALAKSRHELTVFEAAFDDYFQPIPERPRGRSVRCQARGVFSRSISAATPDRPGNPGRGSTGRAARQFTL